MIMNLIDRIKEQEGFASLKPIDDEQIKEAELALNLKFAEDYKQLLREFGIFSIIGHELTGICKSKRLNVVDVTSEEKTINKNIPEGLYVVELLNIDDVVIWQSADGKIYQSEFNSVPVEIHKNLESYLFD